MESSGPHSEHAHSGETENTTPRTSRRPHPSKVSHLIELIVIIAAILALSSWLVRTHFVQSAAAHIKSLEELQRARDEQHLLEGVQRQEQRASKSILRVEDGMDRLILHFAPSTERPRMERVIHLMAAMENEQWAENWTEDVESWQARFQHLNDLTSRVALTQSEAGVFLRHWMAFQTAANSLYQLRTDFVQSKQVITGMRTFDAKSIADQPFVPDLIQAFEEHGSRARELYLATNDAYLGIGQAEAKMLTSLQKEVESEKVKQDRAEAFAYAFFVVSALLGITAKIVKVIL